MCEIDPTWKPDPDEVAPDDEEAACVVDRSTIEFGVGFPVPHTLYHWAGYETNKYNFAGAKATIEVRNPEVDHVSPDEFVASRVLTQVKVSDEWLEVGWAEVSWRTITEPEVYTFVPLVGVWLWYTSYDLSNGSFYKFRTRDCNVSGEDRQRAEIYWDGQWQLLTNYVPGYCRTGQGSARCNAEEFTEVYSEQQGNPHPDLTGAPGNNIIDWKDTKLKNDIGNWIQWTRPSTEASPTAYRTCGINDFYRFYAKKGSC